MNANRAWWEVRIGLRGPFGLVGRLRHRDRRRPRRGHRAVRQGQRRPPPGCNEVRQKRTGTCFFLSPHLKVALGRGLFCAGGGEAARARNCGQTGPLYRPCRSLGHGRPRYRAPRVWQWVRAAPRAAGPSARAELLIYAKRLGKLARAQRWGWAAGPPYMRKPRLPCGLPLREARRGARACGGPNPATWETWDVRVLACGGTCPLGRGCRRGLSRSAETSLNNYYSPVCVRLVYSPSRPCPQRAGACIVLPRAAPQLVRPREPREPDTAEDAGGQTDHLGQAL